ncbi:hypothetical protein C0J52_00219, partial [Blattella germanica]
EIENPCSFSETKCILIFVYFVLQILHFILNHSEMVCMVLSAGSPHMPLQNLKELARLTGIIARSAYQEMCHVTAADLQAELSAQLHRIQNLMLALIPRFVVSESVLRELTGSATIATSRTPAISGPDSRQTEHMADYYIMGESTAPGLGVVVQQLVRCVEHYHREKATLDLLTRKLTSVSNMNSTELKENTLYLVWSHLDYYMLRSLPQSFSVNIPATFLDSKSWFLF